MCDVERFLYRYLDYEKEIKYVEVELEQEKFKYENQKDSFLRSSIDYNTKVSKTNNISRPVEIAVDGLITHYAKRVQNKVTRLNLLCSLQDGILHVVDDAKLNMDEKMYVELRYYKGIKVFDIAKKMGYSERNLNRTKQVAIGKVLFCKAYLDYVDIAK